MKEMKLGIRDLCNGEREILQSYQNEERHADVLIMQLCRYSSKKKIRMGWFCIMQNKNKKCCSRPRKKRNLNAVPSQVFVHLDIVLTSIETYPFVSPPTKSRRHLRKRRIWIRIRSRNRLCMRSPVCRRRTVSSFRPGLGPRCRCRPCGNRWFGVGVG